jgi:hypothetical protein
MMPFLNSVTFITVPKQCYLHLVKTTLDAPLLPEIFVAISKPNLTAKSFIIRLCRSCVLFRFSRNPALQMCNRSILISSPRQGPTKQLPLCGARTPTERRTHTNIPLTATRHSANLAGAALGRVAAVSEAGARRLTVDTEAGGFCGRGAYASATGAARDKS